jgi:hypothetical protein
MVEPPSAPKRYPSCCLLSDGAGWVSILAFKKLIVVGVIALLSTLRSFFARRSAAE